MNDSVATLTLDAFAPVGNNLHVALQVGLVIPLILLPPPADAACVHDTAHWYSLSCFV